MMACSDALMDQDQLLSAFFTSDPSWSLSGNELTLTNDSITMSLSELLTEE
jgi:heat shock protein HslJ